LTVPARTIDLLRDRLGPDRVLSGDADLLLYAYDSALDRARPDAVLLPRTAEEVRQAVALCLEKKVPYIARGAGTNLSGGCIPLKGGVVLSTARLQKIHAIDTVRRCAVVEPGVVNLRLQQACEPLGFFYAPDPASYRVCTVGGNIAENSGGPRCLKYGVTSNHVLGVEAVMPDASLQRFRIDEAGPDLAGLLVGSEGTLGVVTKAWLKITPSPETIRTLLSSFKTVEEALQSVSEIVAAGIVPRVLECMDQLTVRSVEEFVHAGYPKNAGAVLLIELDGPEKSVETDSRKMRAILKACGALEIRSAADPAERERLWEGRRGAYAALARIAPNVLVEDGVVPRGKLYEALKRIREITDKHEVTAGLLFHAGDGNLHPNIVFDERNQNQTKRAKKAGYEILKTCVALGGSISGEHGIGVDKRAAMAWLFPPATLSLFRRIKKALDPETLANPDKVIPLAAEGDMARTLLRPAPKPLSQQAQALVERAQKKEPFVIVGRGTRLPDEFRQGSLVSTAGLDRLVELDKADYVSVAEAGIQLSQLKSLLEKEGFHLPAPADRGSLGGLIASKAWPDFRDYVLGMRVLLPGGEVAELGGRVVKNVAGYDVPKLLFGSWGALAIILEVTFKVLPEPLTPSPKVAAPEFWLHPGAWHRKIKSAFDPENQFNPWVFKS
jgi:glycolate oxidase subunit GlcD